MKISIALLASIFLPLFSLVAQVNAVRLLTENMPDPIGLDSRQPRLSWQIEAPAADRNVLQTAYEIRVDERPEGSGVWNSGKTVSGESVQIVYAGAALQAGKKYFWQVRVWDNKGRSSPWSKAASWRMGLLTPQDWKASWIEPALKEEPSQPSPLMRTTFSAKKAIASATLFVTAHGLYEAQLNGQRVGQAYLTPGWTSYNKRLQYQAYDVTGMIKPGKNAIGALLGSGWYRGNLCYDWQRNIYGSRLGLLLQLVIQYKDGKTDIVASGPGWKYSTGEVVSSEIYDGETVDHRLEKQGWSMPDYDAAAWNNAEVAELPKENLVATANEPVKKQTTFRALKLLTTPKGETVIDKGPQRRQYLHLPCGGVG
jgi:alpha-L-rhamnosidase